MKCAVMSLLILIFLCHEYQVTGEEKHNSNLFLKIAINRVAGNNIIQRKVVNGGNICVEFVTDFNIDEIGLLASNQKSPRWAPDKSTLPYLEIDKDRQKLIAEFHGLKKSTSWNLVILHARGFCNEKDRNNITIRLDRCSYERNGLYFLNLTYTVTLNVTDYVNVTVNGNQLTAYSMSGDIPSNMVFLYEFKYRPGDYKITFTYLGEENPIILTYNGSLNKTGQTHRISKSLLGIDNGTTINYRVFTNETTNEEKLNIFAYITFIYVPVTDLLNVQVNGITLQNPVSSEDYGDTYNIYYNNNEKYNITCSLSNKDVCIDGKCHMSLCIPSLTASGVTSSCEESSSKPVSKMITLREADDGSQVNCTYSSDAYGDIKTVVEVKFILIQRKIDIWLTVKGKEIKTNSTYEIDDESKVKVECFVIVTRNPKIGAVPPTCELLLQKNNEQFAIRTPINLASTTTKQNAFGVTTIKENDNLTCVFKELGKTETYKSFIVMVKRTQTTTTIPTTQQPTSSSPITTLVIPGDDHIIGNSEETVSGQTADATPDWYIYAIAGGAGIVIIVIIVCIIKVAKKKARDADELVPAEYETMTDTPPPNFPQNATLEETYCRPADTKNSEPTYAQPYVPKSPEELYAKPVPKNARKKPPKDKLYATLEFENAYAKIKPKNERNKQYEEPGYAEVGKYNDEPTYASVQQYANMNNSEDANNREEYYNVFDNSSYANSRQNAEYVEPSYCEVSKIRK